MQCIVGGVRPNSATAAEVPVQTLGVERFVREVTARSSTHH
jgi:hypothetical protein